MALFPDGMIPTKAHGPLPEDSLVRTEGVIDGPTEFRVWIEFHRGAELMARFEFVSFSKGEFFAGYPEGDLILTEENGVRAEVPVASLEKLTGADDGPQAWVPWVEFRRPGDPTILHRNCHPHIKRGLQLGI